MKKFLSFFAFALLMTVSCCTLYSCGGDDEEGDDVPEETGPVSVTDIEILSPSDGKGGHKVTLEKGKSFQIVAHVLPENATDQKLLYVCNRPNLATVDEKGLVTALEGSQYGPVTIWIKAHENNFTRSVTIDIPKEAVHATSINFSQPSYTIDAGETKMLYVNVSPANAVDPSIVFTSSNPKVLNVAQQSGYMCVVEGLDGGTATLTAKTSDGNLTATTTVTVNPSTVQSISLGASNISMKKGGTHLLKATVKMSDGTTVTSNEGVEFSSTDPSVATVSSDGLVKAIYSGTTRISAKIGGKSASIICKVQPFPPSTASEALQMLKGNYWKSDKVKEFFVSGTWADEQYYYFTEDGHFYVILHVGSNVSSTSKFYPYRGQYVGYYYKKDCKITPNSSNPTKGKINIEGWSLGSNEFIPNYELGYSNLTSESWTNSVGSTTMTRVQDQFSFIILEF